MGSQIFDSTFRGNIGRGVIEITSSFLIITNTVFDGNISDESPSIKATSSGLTMANNIFTNTNCYIACYLWIYTFSVLRDENSIFQNANAED